MSTDPLNPFPLPYPDAPKLDIFSKTFWLNLLVVAGNAIAMYLFSAKLGESMFTIMDHPVDPECTVGAFDLSTIITLIKTVGWGPAIISLINLFLRYQTTQPMYSSLKLIGAKVVNPLKSIEAEIPRTPPSPSA